MTVRADCLRTASNPSVRGQVDRRVGSGRVGSGRVGSGRAGGGRGVLVARRRLVRFSAPRFVATRISHVCRERLVSIYANRHKSAPLLATKPLPQSHKVRSTTRLFPLGQNCCYTVPPFLRLVGVVAFGRFGDAPYGGT
jgi:hypothetical protein